MPATKHKSLAVVFVGEKLAGKEMASRYLIKRHRFVGYRFSKILVSILNQLNLPISRLNETNLAGALRERFGSGVLAETIKSLILDSRNQRVVIDGLRHPAELEALKRLPGFLLVYLTAPLEVRFRRALKRRERVGEGSFSLADFKREERLPTEVFIHGLGRKAKVKLVNDDGLKDLYEQIEDKIIKVYCK